MRSMKDDDIPGKGETAYDPSVTPRQNNFRGFIPMYSSTIQLMYWFKDQVSILRSETVCVLNFLLLRC